MKRRVLSGMRPTGKLHLGHLHGTLDNWVKLQEEYDCFFFIADWHALTSEYENTGVIRESIAGMLVDWLSAGIDPDKSTLFIQSRLLEHAELHLLLSMIVPLPWLERNPTYKEKQEEIKERDLSDVDWIHRYFGLDSHDPALFDLIINTSKFTPALAADLIVRAAAALPARSR